MESKKVFLAVYGKNQVPFGSYEELVQYFQNSGSLFEGVMDSVLFYELDIKQIVSPLKTD